MLRVVDGVGDTHHTEEVRIDLESMTILSQEMLDDPSNSYEDYLWPSAGSQ